MRSWKSTILLPWSLKFNPRYFPGVWTNLTPKKFARFCLVRSSRFGEQNNSDLLRLMLCLERLQVLSYCILDCSGGGFIVLEEEKRVINEEKMID